MSSHLRIRGQDVRRRLLPQKGKVLDTFDVPAGVIPPKNPGVSRFKRVALLRNPEPRLKKSRKQQNHNDGKINAVQAIKTHDA